MNFNLDKNLNTIDVDGKLGAICITMKPEINYETGENLFGRDSVVRSEFSPGFKWNGVVTSAVFILLFFIIEAAFFLVMMTVKNNCFTHWVETVWKHQLCLSSQHMPAAQTFFLLHLNCDLTWRIWKLIALRPCPVQKSLLKWMRNESGSLETFQEPHLNEG